MKKTFAAFVAFATIAGSLATTPVSASVSLLRASQLRAVMARPYHRSRAIRDFGSCEWVTQRFWNGHGWRVRRVRACC